MAKVGWKKLEQHEGEDGTVCEIRMEMATGKFRASVGKDYSPIFESEGTDITKVREEVKKYLEGCALSGWEPVIFVKRPKEKEEETRYYFYGPDLGTISFDYERYFKAIRADKRVVWKEFTPVGAKKDGYGRESKAVNLDKLDGKPGESCPTPGAYENQEYATIPYTPERWSALRGITRRIEEINARIREQLSPKNAQAFLDRVVTGGARAFLSAPVVPDPQREVRS